MSAIAETNKHFLFRSEQSWFSLPAVAVREVTIAPQLVVVPGCHESLEGLCHLRSEFIPVISLAALLDIDCAGGPAANQQLITLTGTSVWAMRIAQAAALESLETIAAPSGRHADSAISPVVGTAIYADQVVRVLDPTRLYRLAHQAILSTSTSLN